MIHVEYSNEVWNGGIAQFHQVLAAAKANPLVTAGDDFGKVARQAAYKLKGISDIFRQLGPNQSSRVQPVFGAFEGWDYFAKTGLDFVQRTYHTTEPFFFSAMAVAPYVDVSRAGVDQAGLTMDALFADMNNNLNTTVAGQIRANKAVADAYGLTMMAYGGGPGIVSFTGLNGPLKQAAQDDPRMGQLYRDLSALWDRNGGGLFNTFSHIGPYSQFGDWGLLHDMTQPGSEKWDAMMGMILPAGDATLDGRVELRRLPGAQGELRPVRALVGAGRL